MQWFEVLIVIAAVLLVITPIILHVYKKDKGLLKCECGHLQSECTGDCNSCSSKKSGSLTYIFEVEGMKCGMCEGHINDIIRSHFDVIKVKSSRRDNKTIVVSGCFLDIPKVKEEIAKAGYKVTSVHLA